MLSVFDMVSLIRFISSVSLYVTLSSVLFSAVFASVLILYRNLLGLF